MRGSPLLRALLAFVVIFALGYPLWRVTGTTVAIDASAPPPPAPVRSEVTLQVTFTTTPKKFTIAHLGRAIWEETAPAGEMERKVSLEYPREGVELHVTAEFGESTGPSAARIRLTDAAGDDHEQSLWGAGEIDGIVAFQ